MTSIVPRSRTVKNIIHCPGTTDPISGKSVSDPTDWNIGMSTSRLVTSSGNPRNPRTGKRESGGSFFVTHHEVFANPVNCPGIVDRYMEQKYSGPLWGSYVRVPSGIQSHHTETPPSSFDFSSLDADGATAISLVAPTNPTANLATTLAESVREGIPSLPGIQSWKRRTEILRNAGSEYLNYQFGWAPLVSEVHSVVSAARHHRDIMQNYRHNEGSNVHRRFDFDSEESSWEEELPVGDPNEGKANGSIWLASNFEHPEAQRVNRVSTTRKRWFEGCFTYGGPSRTDSFGRAIGFGSEADAVYGLNLNPEVLWELTPWSWAVDWFSNTGDVIKNVSNFALAGLVMRYGYMMEETISESYTEYGPHYRYVRLSNGSLGYTKVGSCSAGERTITRSRAPANPFGFGVGWEGLSPTQLAITAAIGITRSL